MSIDLLTPPAIARSADHFYTYEGERYPGVTGILSILDKSGPLMGWAAKMTAEAAVRLVTTPTVYASVIDVETQIETSVPASNALLGLIESVGEVGTISALTARRNWKLDEARDLGTDVHAMAELVVRGEPTPPMNETTRARVLHYAAWWKASGWTLRLAEAMVVFPTHKYGGTFDLLAYDRDGRTVLADVKTGKGVYKEVALQLAAYSLAPIVAPTGSPKAYPMPKVDRHVVLHVTTEGVREVEIAVGTAEHMAWLACIDLHSWAESMKGKKF
jgi:hypothetical protein